MIETTEEELYKTAFIPKTLGPFNRVRLDMRLTIREIERAFGFEGVEMPRCAWDSYMDVERQLTRPGRSGSFLGGDKGRTNSFLEMADDAQRYEQLRAVSRRLAAEFENDHRNLADTEEAVDLEEEEVEPPRSRSHSTASRPASIVTSATYTLPSGPLSRPTSVISPTGATTAVPSRPLSLSGAQSPRKPRTPRTPRSIYGDERGVGPLTEVEAAAVAKVLAERGPAALLADFKVFNDVQHELITKALTGGSLVDCSAHIRLRVSEPQPSVLEMYGHDHVRGRLMHHPSYNLMERSAPPSPVRRRRRVRYEDDEEPGPCGRRRDRVPKRDGSQESHGESDVIEDESNWPLGLRMGLAGDHSLIKVYSLLFAFE